MGKMIVTESGRKNQQVKAVIRAYMAMNNMETKDIARRMNISVSSFFGRMREPDTFKICELRCLRLSEEEWAKLR